MTTRLTFILLLCAFATTPTSADLYVDYGFRATADATATDAEIGEAQFSVRVSDVGATEADALGVSYNQVLFTFQNAGPASSSITDIYFYDGALLGYLPPATLDWSSGVLFTEGAKPPDVPGLPDDGVTRIFSADSAPPTYSNGVNPGEWLSILFTLTTGMAFDDVIEGLERGITDPMIPGNITIGIHVQGFDDGGSASFVHAPVPAAVLLGMLGMGVAGLKLRKYV